MSYTRWTFRRRELSQRVHSPVISTGMAVVIAAGLWSCALNAAPSDAPQTGAAAAQQPLGTDAPVAPLRPMQGDLGRPYYLPPATRARTHECAIAWQNLKLSGGAGSITWRVFATGCLTNGPDVKPAGTAGAGKPALDTSDGKK